MGRRVPSRRGGFVRDIPSDLSCNIALTTGRIALLIKIELASGEFLYTNWDSIIQVGGDNYSPRAFEPSAVSLGLGQQTGEISVAIDDVDAGALRSASMNDLLRGRPFWLSFCMLSGNLVIGGDDGMITIFGGRIKGSSINLDQCKLSVQSWLGQQNRKIPQENFGPQCRFIFRGTACGYTHADAEKLNQTADAGCSTTVINDAARIEAADWWAGGWLVFTTGGAAGLNRRIKTSAAGVLTLAHALYVAPAAGDLYNVY